MPKSINRVRLCWQGSIIFALLGTQPIAAGMPDLDCVIEPYMIVDLSSQVDGIVEEVTAERGDLVERDQILVELDAGVEKVAVDYAQARADATAQLRAGQVSVSFAQRRQGRVQSLYLEQAISFDQKDEVDTEADLSQLQLDQAEETNKLARLELRRTQETLKRHSIRSPIRGVVVQRYLSPGESVKDVPIMRLAQIDPLRVEVIVPVTSFGKIEVGQSAIIRPESPKEGEYRAEVMIVDRVADAASGTFRVALSLPNPDYDLPSGLRCRIQFLPNHEQPETRIAVNAPQEISPENQANAFPAAERAAANRPTADTLAAQNSITVSTRGKVCRTFGPIDSVVQATKIKDAISQKVEHVSLRAQAHGETEQFLVLSRQRETMSDVRLLAEQMKSEGMTDLYIIGEGQYEKRSYAEKRQGDIASRGFDADLVTSRKELKEFWLDVQIRNDKAVVKELDNTLANLLPVLSATSTPCDALVAHRK